MHQPHPTSIDSEPAAGLRLPLVAMEHYMLADDRPTYPMVFFIRLHLDRRLVRDRFERVLEAALCHHPLLSAHLEEAAGRWRHWTWRPTARPAIYWNDPNADSAPPIDLTRECGLRIRVDEAGDGASLTFQVHHSCADGLGALAFIEEVLSAYAAGPANPSSATAGPRPAAVARLRRRGRFGLGPLRVLLRMPLELLGAIGSLEFFMHKPVPVAGTASQAVTPAWPAACWHAFSPDESRRLRAVAATHGATLNDLLLRDMFLTLGDWIERHDAPRHGKHVRVMVPVNLRTRRDGDLSAANVVAMINVDRRPHRWRNRRRMLRIVHWEMAVVKRLRLGLTFIRGLQLVHYVFNGLKRLMPAERCMSTCVLSNLGDLWRGSRLAGPDGRLVAGDVTVRDVELMPPIRPLTHAALGVSTYAGQLNVSLNFDRHSLTPAEGQELLDTLVRRLEGSLAE